MMDATRSMAECAASVTIAIEPVIAPAASLAAISSVFDATDTQAAPALVWVTGTPPRVLAAARGRPGRDG